MKLLEPIIGQIIYLRILEITDANDRYVAWLNDKTVNQYLETHHATILELKEYIHEKLESENTLFFGIFWRENNRHIGNVKLEPIDFQKSAATMGLLIGDKNYWGKGIATEVTNMMVNFVFQTLGLQEINLGVRPDHTIAMHVYEKCGFKIYRSENNRLYMLKRK